MPHIPARKLAALAVSLGALLAAQPAPAKGPRVDNLKPMSAWNAEWSEKSCFLRRAFGDKDNGVTLQIEQVRPEEGFTLIMVSDRLLSLRQGGAYSLTFGDGAEGAEHSARIGRSTGGTATLVVPETQLPAAEEEIHSIIVGWVHDAFRLETGPLAKPMAALRACTEDLARKGAAAPVG